MKKQLAISVAVFTAFSVLTASCSNKEDTPPPKTKTQLLTQASWKFSSATAAGTDITNNPLLACIKDNVTVFVSDGTGNNTEGPVICVPTTAGNFTWSFQSGETVLSMSGSLFPGGTGTFNLVTLNETTLVVSQNVTIPPSTTSVLVQFTFVH